MSALENITDQPLGATVVGWRFTDWDIRLNNAAKRGPVCADVDDEPGLFGVFDQHAGTYQGAGDATEEGLEQAFEFEL